MHQQYQKIIFQPLYLSILMLIITLFFLLRLSDQQEIQYPPIKVEREFRAAWVATVANINWPSEPGLSTEIQQQEAIDILDSLQSNNFNAVVFQVRPQADALYQSDIEPWSYYLTGVQGQAPSPFYDPLEFWINEAHKRGLKLHAWLNPYRAHHIKGGEVSEFSVVKTHPNLVVQLAMGYYWMVPTKQETIDYSLSVVMDIVKRYDIDGIHFDDYFYPYPSYNEGQEFPDAEDFAQYQKDGGELSRNDWRRDSVNSFVETVYKAIKAEKKYVKFGLSPFGIWRPGYPESIAGFDQYEKLFADAKLWLNEGWVDYFSPQLYWEINRYEQSFPMLLNWWETENTEQRHLWPGLQTRQGEDDKAMDETINQIMISRAMLSNRPGNVFWNVGSLKNNPLFSELLTTGPYQKQALIPAFTWLDSESPAAPIVQTMINGGKLNISWMDDTNDDISHWVVYTKYAEKWQYQIVNAGQHSLSVDRSLVEPSTVEEAANGEQKVLISQLIQIGVTAIDRAGNESVWELPIIIDQSL